MEEPAQVSLSMDGRELAAPEGATILEAARLHGIYIPTLCHHPDLPPWGGCRLCVVEVDTAPRLVASCVMPVRAGMEVVTHNPRLHQARRAILEFLFSERPHYCMFCAQSGDCQLQALAYEHGLDHLTVPPLGQEFAVDASHPDLVMDHNRCVLCGRCVRACRDLAGNQVLDFHNRGGATSVGADLHQPWGQSSCVGCGTCLQFCPTGAIFNRGRTHYAVLGKPQDWHTVDSFCPLCGLLCPTKATVRANRLIKIEASLPAEPAWQAGLCRRGRFEPLKEQGPRLLAPMLRVADGAWQEASWPAALDQAGQALAALAGEPAGGQAMLALISGGCAQEELSAFGQLARAAWPAGRLDTLDGPAFRALAQAGGQDFGEAPWEALRQADLIVQVGLWPARDYPMLHALIRQAVLGHQAKLAVLGGHNEVGAWAAVHLEVGQAELPALLAQLKNPAPGAAVGELAGLLAQSRRPLWLAGPGLADMRELVRLARCAPAWCGPGLPLILLKPAGNSAAAWSLGLAAAQDPAPAPAWRGGLVCLDGEQGPPDWVAGALKGLKCLVALTPYRWPWLEAGAQVLLPRPTWLEGAGRFAGPGGRAVAKPALLMPPAGVPPADQTLAALGLRLGVKVNTGA